MPAVTNLPAPPAARKRYPAAPDTCCVPPHPLPSPQRVGGHDQPVCHRLGPAGCAVHLAAHLDARTPVSAAGSGSRRVEIRACWSVQLEQHGWNTPGGLPADLPLPCPPLASTEWRRSRAGRFDGTCSTTRRLSRQPRESRNTPASCTAWATASPACSTAWAVAWPACCPTLGTTRRRPSRRRAQTMAAQRAPSRPVRPPGRLSTCCLCPSHPWEPQELGVRHVPPPCQPHWTLRRCTSCTTTTARRLASQ